MGLAVTFRMELVAIDNWMELKHYFTAASQIHQLMGPMNRWMNCPPPPLGAVERLFGHPPMNRWMYCPRIPLGAVERLFGHPDMRTRKEKKRKEKLCYLEICCYVEICCFFHIIIPKLAIRICSLPPYQ